MRTREQSAAVDYSIQAVDLVFTLGGTTSIYEVHQLERCLRDIPRRPTTRRRQPQRHPGRGSLLPRPQPATSLAVGPV